MENLGSLVRIRTGKLDANAADENGEFPFFTCSREPLKINTPAFDCSALLIAGNGDLNVKKYRGKFNAYQRTYVVEPHEELVFLDYLYYFMFRYVDFLRQQSIGGVIKYIKLGMLTDAKIPLPPMAEQRRIVEILDAAQGLIDQRKEQIALMDQLVQSLFYDMFGDPVTNPMGWEVKKLGENVKGRYGVKAGPFGSALKKEDYVSSGFRVYGQEQVIGGRFDIGDYYINAVKLEKLKNCEVSVGDILISLVGSYGKILIVPEGVERGIINPRLVKVTLEQTVLKPRFFVELFRLPPVQLHLSASAHGGTMGILNAGILKEMKCILPPIALQTEFAKRVEKIEVQKASMTDSLSELENTFNALMQRAFKGEL